MRNIHEINAALFESKYEVVHEKDNWIIYDLLLPPGYRLIGILENMEDILWFIIDNCILSRKPD